MRDRKASVPLNGRDFVRAVYRHLDRRMSISSFSAEFEANAPKLDRTITVHAMRNALARTIFWAEPSDKELPQLLVDMLSMSARRIASVIMDLAEILHARDYRAHHDDLPPCLIEVFRNFLVEMTREAAGGARREGLNVLLLNPLEVAHTMSSIWGTHLLDPESLENVSAQLRAVSPQDRHKVIQSVVSQMLRNRTETRWEFEMAVQSAVREYAKSATSRKPN